MRVDGSPACVCPSRAAILTPTSIISPPAAPPCTAWPRIAPYVTHPDLPQFHRQLDECGEALERIGAKARRLGIRLSFHPSQYILLNSPDEGLTERSLADFAYQAEVLDRMGLDDKAVMVTHVRGVYGEHDVSRARWAERWDRLPDFIRRRLVLEHDDLRFSAADALWLHERTGVRLVFDHQLTGA